MQRRNKGAPQLGNPGSHPLPHWFQNRWAKPAGPPPSLPRCPSKQPSPGSFLLLGTLCSEPLDRGLSSVPAGAPTPGLELPSSPLRGLSPQATWKDVCSIKIPQELSRELAERARALDSASCGPNAGLPLGSHGGSGALSVTSWRPHFPTCDMTSRRVK